MKFVFALLMLSLATKAHALVSFETRDLTLESGARVHVEIAKGKRDKPVFVFTNGLIYGLEKWDRLSHELTNDDATVIRYAYSLQPESLRLLEAKQEPPSFRSGLKLDDLTVELDEILVRVGMGQKRVHLVGLSYGASVATDFALKHEDRVANLILLSPLVVPLNMYDANGRALANWLNAIRFWENAPCEIYGAWNPWLCTARDMWYDSFYNWFYTTYLHARVQAVPEGLDGAVFKKSVFHLVRAVRDFDLRTLATKLRSLHLITAGGDSSALLNDQDRVWNDVAQEQRKSYIVIRHVKHALPEASPITVGRLLKAIGNGEPAARIGEKIEIEGDEAL